jgi:hypothetical protein
MSSILTAGGLSLLLMSAGDLVHEPGPQTTSAQQVALLSNSTVDLYGVVDGAERAQLRGEAKDHSASPRRVAP